MENPDDTARTRPSLSVADNPGECPDVPKLQRHIGVAVDLCGCPNRCRHCYLGGGPNRRLPVGTLREVADAFWGWKRPGGAIPWFEQVDVSSSYREPDFSEDYKALYELERTLSRRAPRRYELLSAWRLANDGNYPPWAVTLGPKTCQLTFFGGREKTDWFAGRHGAFNDNLKATERLLEVGMVPRWQIMLTKPTLPDLPLILSLAKTLKLRERVAEIGAEFDLFAHLPAPDGEAFKIEQFRVEAPDVSAIPEELLESTRKHFGGIGWETEATVTARVLAGETIPAFSPEPLWFFIDSDLDVYTNFGDLSPGWRLGNFRRDGLDGVFAAFESDAPPAYEAAFHVPDDELATRFGRRASQALYSPSDLKSRWIRLFCEALVPR